MAEVGKVGVDVVGGASARGGSRRGRRHRRRERHLPGRCRRLRLLPQRGGRHGNLPQHRPQLRQLQEQQLHRLAGKANPVTTLGPAATIPDTAEEFSRSNKFLAKQHPRGCVVYILTYRHLGRKSCGRKYSENSSDSCSKKYHSRSPVRRLFSERNVHNKPNAAAPRTEINLDDGDGWEFRTAD